MDKKDICIIIPAYNEEKSLPNVIDAIRKVARKSHIVVIDDGSIDKTSQIAKYKHVEVVKLPFNLGIGGSVQTGLKYAYNNGFDISIQVDADGQHNPEYIPKLLSALHDVDMVIGSRYLEKSNYKSAYLRLLGVSIFSYLIKLVTGKKIYDCTSGFRVINKRAISFLIKNYPIDFPEPESIVKLLKNGFTIREIPVEMNKRTEGKSSVTPFKAIYFMLSISIAILIEGIKEKKRSYE